MRPALRSSRWVPRLGRTSSSRSQPSPCAYRAGSHWDASVTPELARGLLRDGFYVIPNAFPTEYLRRLRDEMELLRTSGQLYPNSTHILTSSSGPSKTLLLEKHGILETELALDAVRDQIAAPFLRDFFDQQVVFGPLQRALPEWMKLAGHMVKVQHSAGNGACFPMHFDTYGSDGKCVTAVLYLNEHWRPGDGGEIVLYPFPKERVIVQPRFGELVLFSSQQMLHRVLPAMKPRFALTTWTYHLPSPAAKTESAAYYKNIESSIEGDENAAFQAMVAKILRSPFRRHLLQLVYKEEWKRSLHESHLPTDAFEQYIATHEQEVQVIEAATSKMLDNFRAKDGEVSSTLPTSSSELLTRMQDGTNREFTNNIQLSWF